MKCSHGLPYEVRCQGCMQDALARAGVQPLQAPPVLKMLPDQKPPLQQWTNK